ncbi:MAG: hypothetical protein L6V93_06465 [Clostridiales bacterium]|nr:MAG: hypothetical protein L6V93_06465 [Clostridiales bacterium]
MFIIKKIFLYYPRTIRVVASNTPDFTEPIAVTDIPDVMVLSAASLPVELFIIFVALPTNTDCVIFCAVTES